MTFQKTLSVNDWYRDGGDGYPLGAMQLIGKVQGVMMKSCGDRGVPRACWTRSRGRSVEWLVMAEDLPSPDNRVIIDGPGASTTARAERGRSTHRRLLRRAKRLLRAAGYDAVFTQSFDISMNSHQCGTVVAGADPAPSVLDPWCRATSDEPVGRRRRLLPVVGGDEPRAHDRGAGAPRRGGVGPRRVAARVRRSPMAARPCP